MKFSLVSSLVVVVFIAAFSGGAWAYVENVTHGYQNCLACHYSPAGGNLLTDYGRSLSKDVMSTWGGWKGSEKPLFGAFDTSENVVVGGDIRTIQTYFENNEVEQGRNFLMQQNFEVGIPWGNVMAVGSFGTQEGPREVEGRGTFLSERHYLLWTPDPTSRLRVGKFRQRFGLNDPNHRRFVKNLFGFGSLSEIYGVEYTKFYEKYEIALTSSLGRIDEPRGVTERSQSVTFAHALNGKSRVGGSYLIGESRAERRSLAGVFALVPLTEKLFVLSEIDHEESFQATNPSESTITIASQTRLGYRPFKGVHSYLLLETASEDSPSSYSLTHSPGIGIQWFPIPHVEIHLEYQRTVSSVDPGQATDSAWAMLHLYPF